MVLSPGYAPSRWYLRILQHNATPRNPLRKARMPLILEQEPAEMPGGPALGNGSSGGILRNCLLDDDACEIDDGALGHLLSPLQEFQHGGIAMQGLCDLRQQTIHQNRGLCDPEDLLCAGQRDAGERTADGERAVD